MNQPEQSQRPRLKLDDIPEEEKLAFKSCTRKAFLYGSLPGAFAGVVAGSVLHKYGFVKWGTFGRFVLPVGLGYIAGQVIYVRKCWKEIVNQFPNGGFATLIKERQNRSGQDVSFTDRNNDVTSVSEATERFLQAAEDANKRGYDLKYQPDNSGQNPSDSDFRRLEDIRDRRRKFLHGQQGSSPPPQSYGEENSSSYDQPSANDPDSQSFPQGGSAANNPKKKRQRYNQYGDPIED